MTSQLNAPPLALAIRLASSLASTWALGACSLTLANPTFGEERDAGRDAGALDAGGCTPNAVTCSDSETLRICNANGTDFEETTCVAGCLADGTPRCAVIVPTLPVTPSHLLRTDVVAVMLPAGDTILRTDTGEISGGFARPPNVNFAMFETINGVGYQQVGGVGVFVFGPLLVASGSVVKLIGLSAVALVTTGELTIAGVLDARPMDGDGALCPAMRVGGPGGGRGGANGFFAGVAMSGETGEGPSGGAGGERTGAMGSGGGGGGAGGSGRGGDGAASADYLSGPGGSVLSPPMMLRGGSGGGGGGSAPGLGGGGGGAVQLVAATRIVIGSGATPQGVNVGGCGGRGAAGAGGGGSGGMILLEAARVEIGSLGTLVANGGGGGGVSVPGGTPVDGEPGRFDDQPALGAGSGAATAAGNGGAGEALAGTNAVVAVTGGGGAAGFVRISTRSGDAAISPQAVLSPARGTTGLVFAILDAQ